MTSPPRPMEAHMVAYVATGVLVHLFSQMVMRNISFHSDVPEFLKLVYY